MSNVHSSVIPLRSWIVLSAIGLLIFLVNIDYTAVNLTLVKISEEINADLNSLQWLLSAYVLVWAAFVIPAGRVADLYGKRNTLVAGLTIFMLGSCLTGVGHSIEMLVVGRILQGIGAAVFTAPAWASIFTLAPPEKQGFVMGVIVSFAGLGLAAGPTLAGFIIEELSWRWIFYINIPIGILVIAILILYSPKEVLESVKEKIDYVGSLLLGSGLCTFMYGLNQIEVWGIHNHQFWQVIGLGLGLVLAFVLWNRRSKTPMVPGHLFKNKPYMAVTFGCFFMSINFSMVLVLMGLYLQNTLKYTTYETGLIFIAMTITMGVFSPLGGKMIDRFGVQMPMKFGALCAIGAFMLMANLTVDSSLIYVVGALFLTGTGLGAYFTACSTAMLWSAPQKDLNLASGVYMMFMMMANTLSIILSTSFVVLFGRRFLLSDLQANGMVLTAQQTQDMIDVIAQVEHTAAPLKDFDAGLVPQVLHMVDAAFVHGLSINMYTGSLFAMISFGLTVWGLGKLKAPEFQSATPAPVV